MTTETKNYLSLHDNAELSGARLDEAKKAVEGVAGQTFCTPLSVEEIPYFLSYAPAYDKALIAKEGEGTNKVPFFLLSKEALDKVQGGQRMQAGYALKAKLPDTEVVEEMKASTQLVVKFNDEFAAVSSLAVGSLVDRAGLGGPAVYDNSLLRNEHLIDALYSSGKKLQLVWRKDPNGSRKVFGVMSWKYKYVPQTMILDVLDKMKVGADFTNPVVRQWSITHDVTRIYVEYPDEIKDNLIPGIELRTSDIGRSSFTVYATMRREGKRDYVIVGEVSHRHTGEKTEQILDEIDEHIYPELRIYPTLLKELDVPVSGALLSEDDKTAQLEKIEKIYKKIFNSLKCGIAGKRKKELCKALIDEVNPDNEYTYRDIAEQILSVPDRVIGIDIDSSSFRAFKKELGHVPFILRDVKNKVVTFKKEEDEESEILLA